MRNIDRQSVKAQSREAIKGKVWHYFFPILIVGLISAALNAPVYYLNSVEYYGGNALSIVFTLLLFPTAIGLNLYFLNALRHGNESLNNLFDTYKKPYSFWNHIEVYILKWLFIVLGFICLIVPGIIMALKYSLVEYVIADNPNLSCREIMRKSADMTRKRKGEIFCFYFSFFWWWCLVAITCGLAAIYVAPYELYATTMFYNEIKNEFEPQAQSTPDGGLYDQYGNYVGGYDQYGNYVGAPRPDDGSDGYKGY